MKIELTIMKLLIFCSLLCSSDTVAAVSIVDQKAQPKLFSCILGEGVFNDIVAITLYIAIVSLQGQEFTVNTMWLLAQQFAIVGAISILIGGFFGFVSTLAFKSLRFLTRSVVCETFIMFSVGLMSYFVASLTELKGITMSGIISLLSCGVIQAHYCWYNLSPQGQSTTVVTFAFMGQTAEAAVYSQIAISLYFTIPKWWSF